MLGFERAPPKRLSECVGHVAHPSDSSLFVLLDSHEPQAASLPRATISRLSILPHIPQLIPKTHLPGHLDSIRHLIRRILRPFLYTEVSMRFQEHLEEPKSRALKTAPKRRFKSPARSWGPQRVMGQRDEPLITLSNSSNTTLYPSGPRCNPTIGTSINSHSHSFNITTHHQSANQPTPHSVPLQSSPAAYPPLSSQISPCRLSTHRRPPLPPHPQLLSRHQRTI